MASRAVLVGCWEPTPAGSSGCSKRRRTAGCRVPLAKKANLEEHCLVQSQIQKAIEQVESCLAPHAAQHCHVRQTSGALSPRKEELVYSAAFLVSSSAGVGWLEAVTGLRRQLAARGFLVEWSGPWPSYHFCPELRLTENPDAFLF